VLEGNRLQGPIPAALGKLANLKRFLVNGNYLSGELPKSLGNLKNLTMLYVSQSLLIFASYCLDRWESNLWENSKLHRELDTAPEAVLTTDYYFLLLRCKFFYLGTSEFYDPESGKWAYSSTGDFVDNQNPKFITANTTSLDITKPELYMTARLSENKLTVGAILAIVAAACIIVLLILCLIFLYIRRKNSKNNGTKLYQAYRSFIGPIRIERTERLRHIKAATKNFDPANKIGEGGFGPVYKICLGIARGLAYLHEESRLKIVHRDIKATNILLDKDLNAKISDFGLAKLNEEENTHISTRIAGTL
ncbi:hypothetical protein BHM03_00040676, partial [Ensete ventricosum]